MFGLFKKDPDVLVAGAGPVGLYAALNLARRGIAVEIVDSEWRGTTHSYALALHPRSLELLGELGLAEAILAKARKLRRVAFYDGAERRAELDLSKLDSPYPFVAVLAQSQLEDLLVRALEEAGVKVHYHHRLARIEPGADSVNVELHRLGHGSTGYGVALTEVSVEATESTHIPLLLAADGHDSLVRKQLKIGFEPVHPPDVFAVFEFAAGAELPRELCIGLDPESSYVLWPMKNDRYRWSFRLQDGIAGWESREKDRLLVNVGGYRLPHLEPEFMTQLIVHRAPWFAGSVEHFDWRMEVRFEYRLASAFGAGRAWLVGDAAHMAGPVGVHSMNVGFREADELCQIYAEVLETGDTEPALAQYNAARLAEWKMLLGLGAPLTGTGDTPPWLLDNAQRLLPCIPASGQHLSQLLGQLGLRQPPG